MLEDERIETEESYSWRKQAYNEEFREGYYGGKKLGACESVVGMYRHMILKEVGKVWLERLLERDTVEELNRFHDRYRNISEEKMAEHILRESEFLMFFG